MHPYYTLLSALRPDHPVRLTYAAGSFKTSAEDALAVLDELAPGELFDVEVTPC